MAALMTHVLQFLAATTAYVAFLIIRPEKPCRRCRGWGFRPRRRRGRAPCARCGGTGYRFRLGARLVHHAKALTIRWAVQRLRERKDI